MLITHQHPLNKSISIGVIGVPNAGKSSLINHYVGQDLCIVADKPQTTRNQFQCVFNAGRTEVILIDTPGLHRHAEELNRRMNEEVRDGTERAQLVLVLIDTSRDVLAQFKEIATTHARPLNRAWVVFTKSDLFGNVKKEVFAGIFQEAKTFIPSLERYFVTSVMNGQGTVELLDAIIAIAPSAPHRYEGESISNKSERFFAAEYIREQAFLQLRDEVPYELAVVIDEFKDFFEQEDRGSTLETAPEIRKISLTATLIVNRQGQRAIVVGTQGSVIKEIGTKARVRIETLTGAKVFLNLHVKVVPKWFRSNRVLQEIGLDRASDSTRVWRSKS
jgi:GTP-binding protein Era